MWKNRKRTEKKKETTEVYKPEEKKILFIIVADEGHSLLPLCFTNSLPYLFVLWP